MKTLLVCLPLLFAGTLLSAAREGDGEDRRDVRGRRAWFVATGIPDDLENPVTVMTGKDLVSLTLSKRMASEAVRIPADGILKIVRRIANPAHPDQPSYQTLAQVRIPESTGLALVILVPIPNPQAGLVYHAKIQDLAAFKGGDYLYLNHTRVNMVVKLGDHKIALKPGDVKIYDAPDLRKSVNTPVSYHYYHPTRKKWKLLSASTIVLRPTRREICVFSWDPRFERVNYHGITFPVSP